jgi:hypothetical protein
MDFSQALQLAARPRLSTWWAGVCFWAKEKDRPEYPSGPGTRQVRTSEDYTPLTGTGKACRYGLPGRAGQRRSSCACRQHVMRQFGTLYGVGLRARRVGIGEGLRIRTASFGFSDMLMTAWAIGTPLARVSPRLGENKSG